MIDPFGKLLGNVPWNADDESPPNQSTPGSPQPDGTKLLAEGEGYNARQWNRALAAVEMNNDSLVEHLMRTHTCSPMYDVVQISAGSQITYYQVDGWSLLLLGDTFLHRYANITVEKEGGGQPHSRYYNKETGAAPRVTTVDDGAGGAISRGVPVTHVTAKTITAATKYSVTSATNWEDDEHVIPDLICKIVGSTSAAYDGNYRILQPRKTTLELGNMFHRLRMPGISGTWNVMQTVQLASDSTVWGYIVDKDVSDGWVELFMVPDGKSFESAIDVTDGILNADSSETGTLTIYDAPEDPVILDPASVVGATAEVLTNGSCYYRPRYFFDEAIKAEPDRDTYFHFHYYTPNYYGAATPVTAAPLDSSEVMQSLSLFMQSEDAFHQDLLGVAGPSALLGDGFLDSDTWCVPADRRTVTPNMSWEGSPLGRVYVTLSGGDIYVTVDPGAGVLFDYTGGGTPFAAGDSVTITDDPITTYWYGTVYDLSTMYYGDSSVPIKWMRVLMDPPVDETDLPDRGHITATGGKAGRFVDEEDELQGATSSTATLASSASGTTSFYNNCMIDITSGDGAGQTRLITSYNEITKQASITPNWTVTPSATDEYRVYTNSGGLQGRQEPEPQIITDGRLCKRWYAQVGDAKAKVQFTPGGSSAGYLIYVDAVWDDGGYVGDSGVGAGWYARLQYADTSSWEILDLIEFYQRYLVLMVLQWTGTDLTTITWQDAGSMRSAFGLRPHPLHVSDLPFSSQGLDNRPQVVEFGYISNKDDLSGKDRRFRRRLGLSPTQVYAERYRPWGFQISSDLDDRPAAAQNDKALFGVAAGGGDSCILFVRPDAVFTTSDDLIGQTSGAEADIDRAVTYAPGTDQAIVAVSTNDTSFEIGEEVQNTGASKSGRILEIWRFSSAWTGEPGGGRQLGLDNAGDGSVIYPGGTAQTVGYGAQNMPVTRLRHEPPSELPSLLIGGQFELGDIVTEVSSASQGIAVAVGPDFVDIVQMADTASSWSPGDTIYANKHPDTYPTPSTPGSGARAVITEVIQLGVRAVWAYHGAEDEEDELQAPVRLASMLLDGGGQEDATSYVEGAAQRPVLEVPDVQLGRAKRIRRNIPLSKIIHPEDIPVYGGGFPGPAIYKYIWPYTQVGSYVRDLPEDIVSYVDIYKNTGTDEENASDKIYAMFGLDLPDGVVLVDAGMVYSISDPIGGDQRKILPLELILVEQQFRSAVNNLQTYYIGATIEDNYWSGGSPPLISAAPNELSGMMWALNPESNSPYSNSPVYHFFDSVTITGQTVIGADVYQASGDAWTGIIVDRAGSGDHLRILITSGADKVPTGTSVNLQFMVTIAGTGPYGPFTAANVYGTPRTTGLKIAPDRSYYLWPKVGYGASDRAGVRIYSLWVEYLMYDVRC